MGDFTANKLENSQPWRELVLFSAYRLFLSAILFLVCYFDLPPEFVGRSYPSLCASISLLYVFLALFFLIFTRYRLMEFVSIARIQLLVDIVFITLIIYSSGGLESGLGLLLVVVVMAGGALIPGRQATFIAAIATLSVLVEVTYSQIIGDGITKYSHAGMLGITFFASALFAQIVSQKMAMSQLLADKQRQDVTKMALLNHTIISSMKTGILVIDSAGTVTLNNHSAQLMMGDKNLINNQLQSLSTVLFEQLLLWRNHHHILFPPFQPDSALAEVLARFIALDSGETLIYLDNTSALAQQAQQLKLASLGRLTASIAHEIRNPLGAISHAGELLAEANQDDPLIDKLTTIIQRQSSRVNGIIETVLQMSRRKKIEPEVLILADWLEHFIGEFCEIKQIKPTELTLSIASALSKVNIDAEQLAQIMTNLLENAYFHSSQNESSIRIEVLLFRQHNDVIIETYDNGNGVSADILANLFEPFHSNRKGGTGLGLYLARELCQANGGRLNYVSSLDKHCFQISFPIDKYENLQ